jgi:hypothetical protein
MPQTPAITYPIDVVQLRHATLQAGDRRLTDDGDIQQMVMEINITPESNSKSALFPVNKFSN